MPLFIFLAVVIVAYFVYILYLKETKRTQELKRTLDTDNFEKIIEQVKKSQRGDKDQSVSFALARSYFYTNEPEAFFLQKKNFLALAAREKTPATKQGIFQLELMEIVLLYVEENLSKADGLWKKFSLHEKQTHRMAAENNVVDLYLMCKMIHAFYLNEYETVKEIYATLKEIVFEVNKKTIITHYLCRVYESENKKADIAMLIKQISAGDNYYWDLIDRWYE